MIDFLRGQVIDIKEDYIVLDRDGFGYIIYTCDKEEIEISMEIKIYTRLIVREDDLSLYGFVDVDTRKIFDLLRKVSGIGPKTALNIISSLGKDKIHLGILTEDTKILSEAPGVGKKTASRIIIEMKDKIKDINSNLDIHQFESLPTENIKDEALDALMSLGYSEYESKKALQGLDKHYKLEERIRIALSNLGGKNG